MIEPQEVFMLSGNWSTEVTWECLGCDFFNSLWNSLLLYFKRRWTTIFQIIQSSLSVPIGKYLSGHAGQDRFYCVITSDFHKCTCALFVKSTKKLRRKCMVPGEKAHSWHLCFCPHYWLHLSFLLIFTSVIFSHLFWY